MGNTNIPKLCFGDLPELDHVIYLLHELEDVANTPGARQFIEDGPVPTLLARIDAQANWQREESEQTHPGAFDRSYLAEEYTQASALLYEIRFYPCELPKKIGQLILMLHRVMILGNMTEVELSKALDGLARLSSVEEEVENLRGPAETGKKIIDGGNKGNRGDPARDKAIFEKAVALKKQNPSKLEKQIKAEVGECFSIGAEAVKKAIARHKQKNPK